MLLIVGLLFLERRLVSVVFVMVYGVGANPRSACLSHAYIDKLCALIDRYVCMCAVWGCGQREKNLNLYSGESGGGEADVNDIGEGRR